MTYTADFDGVKRDELFAGPEIDVSVWNVKVGSDATITRGMILAGDTINGTFAQATSSDTGKVLCIAADNFTADSDSTVTRAYGSGKFHREKLILPDGENVSTFEEPLRKVNIILAKLKEVF